tara:strand:- start:553 stop:1077 length:525 start_codon:yes stop_codon:yes gene_type:complete
MHIVLITITGIIMTPDLSKIFLNDGSKYKQQLTIDKMATNEFIKTKAIDNAKRIAKKWIGYPPFAFITSGGLAAVTFLVAEQILEIDDEPAFMAALIAGSSVLVGSYIHFNKLDKQSIKAINPENNMLFNETYYKEYKKRKFKNIIASTGLTAAAGTLFFLTTFSLGGEFYFGP